MYQAGFGVNGHLDLSQAVLMHTMGVVLQYHGLKTWILQDSKNWLMWRQP